MLELGFIGFAFLIASPMVMWIIGWGWLVLHALRNDELLWGIACFFVPVLSFLYGLGNYSEVKLPFWLLTGPSIFFAGLYVVLLALGG